ncbi:uncharacterized protein [Anoplolepis gracilipes]|uniref:uncharacterized protein isoform X2 n=1 Tax=Anoplolepis gracilipes TaxID=354296 RepID=UPI003BA11530
MTSFLPRPRFSPPPLLPRVPGLESLLYHYLYYFPHFTANPKLMCLSPNNFKDNAANSGIQISDLLPLLKNTQVHISKTQNVSIPSSSAISMPENDGEDQAVKYLDGEYLEKQSENKKDEDERMENNVENDNEEQQISLHNSAACCTEIWSKRICSSEVSA